MPRSSGVGVGEGASGTRSIVSPPIPSQSSTVLRAGGTAATRTSTASGIATRGQRRRGALEPRTHARRHVGLRRPLELQRAQAIVDAHSSSSSRASARDRRDFTVPGRQPSTAAVSASDSPRK